MFLRLLLTTLLLVPAFGQDAAKPAGKPASAAGARAQIDKLNQAFSAAVAKKDAQAVAAFYHADARIFSAGEPSTVGRDAIEKLWSNYLNAGFGDLKLETETAERHGNVIVEVGRYSASIADKPDAGKYVVVWKRHAGQWKIWIDSFSSDNPPKAN